MTPPATSARASHLYPPNTWWVVRDANGAIGVQRTALGSNVAQSIHIGTADSLNQLGTRFATQLSAAIASIGGTPAQRVALIAQLDAGSGKNASTSYIYAGPTAKPGSNSGVSANTSTTLSGDAAPAGINVASPLSSLAAFLADLTNPGTWVRVLEVIGGVVFIILGLRELANAGGANIPGPSALAGLAAR